MFRLTALLVLSLFAVMSIWGDRPEGDVVVARADSFSPALAGLGGAAPPAEADEGASSISAQEAVEMALAAGEKREDEPVTAAATVPEPAVEEDEGPIVHVTGARVNLRDGPTTNSAIVGTVSRGDTAEPLTDLGDSWVRIRTERGIEAWIYGRFLSETPA